MTEILATIESVIFHNEDNGYTIAIVTTEENEFTAVGYLQSCNEGRTYLMRGDFIVHPKYGEQFSFKESEEKMPTSLEGIKGFLSSGIIKGIGPKAAESIVKKFGTNTFDIIENHFEQLTCINGIGEKKAGAIRAAYLAHREFAMVSGELQKFDIGADYALKLYKVFGGDTVDVLLENPYRLVDEMFGVGFKKADKIAAKVGVDPEDEFRIMAGIKFTLTYFSNEGNTYLPRKLLCEKAAALLDVSMERIEECTVTMAFEGDLHIENLLGEEVVFLMPLYFAEQSVTKHIVGLHNAELKPINADIEALISGTEKGIGIDFSNEQKYAIETSLRNGISVITGGPGTGKTTIINGIIKILEHSGLKTAVAAPTGRAAKRITETTGHEAFTIHRMLEYYYSDEEGSMVFGRNKENTLEYDAIIVDEASMIDLLLMDGLLKAIVPGTRLIIVGDADQLPSVGPGNILRDIIESELIYAIQLKTIFRQAEESLIVVNAHKINKGEYPDYNEKEKDFFFIERSAQTDVVNTIVQLCKSRLPNYYEDCDPIRDIQILTPMRKSTLGCKNLNKILQAALNPPSDDLKEKDFKDRTFREGDKVMQIKNNYSLKWKKAGDFSEGEGVFNGDVGFIKKIDKEFNEIIVIYDNDKYVTYEFAQADELEMAYAVTVHKSQGCEFPIVVMPISWFPEMLATRNLLYTAVTRGKKSVVLVGSPSRMNGMIDNNIITKRYSGLKIRLQGML